MFCSHVRNCTCSFTGTTYYTASIVYDAASIVYDAEIEGNGSVFDVCPLYNITAAIHWHTYIL